MKPAAYALFPPLSIEHFLREGLLGCLVGTWTGSLNLVFLVIVFPGILDDSQFSLIALWGLCGTIAGAIQGGFLQRATRPALLWLLLSATGWLIVGLVDSQGTIAKSTTGNVIAISLFYGGLAALPQTWMRPSQSESPDGISPGNYAEYILARFIYKYHQDAVERP